MSSLTPPDKKYPRVIIYGAGAVGGVVGGHLAHAGNEVILIGRPGHVRAIRELGLKLVTPSATYILPIPTVASPDEIQFKSDDVVFLCVKSQDTEASLRNLSRVARDVPVFCFQNGVRNESLAANYFPRVYGVCIRTMSVFLRDGEATACWDPPGFILLGCYPKGTDALVDIVAGSLRSGGFLVMTTPDIMPYKWGKLLDNLANAITAITGAAEADLDNKHLAAAVRREAEEILTRAGIRWVSWKDLSQEWPESAVPRRKLDVKAPSSTWQSLTRRSGVVETSFFNGEIVTLARQLGLEAPVNEGLLRISEEMAAKLELPGKYTPAALCRLLRV